jgi:rod shape-determining protein MreD
MRKRILYFSLCVIICVVTQLTVLDYFRVFGIKPDLILICVCLANLIFEFRVAFALSIFCGLLKDALSINSFGINTCLFALTSYLILRLSKEIPLDNYFIRLGLVFITALINNCLTGLFFIYSGETISLGIYLRIVFIGSIYTAFTLPLVLKTTEPLFS